MTHEILEKLIHLYDMEHSAIRRVKAATAQIATAQMLQRKTIEEYLEEHRHELRELRGCRSQKKLAEQANTHHTCVSWLESGISDKMSIGVIIRMLQAYLNQEHTNGV